MASPALSDEDFEAIKKGYEIRSKIIHDAILRELYEPKNLFEKQSLNLLANSRWNIGFENSIVGQ